MESRPSSSGRRSGPNPRTTPEPRKRKGLALALLCSASFVAIVDIIIVALALPSVRRDLGFPEGTAQWILSGYPLAFGGFLLLLGRAGDLYGRRRLFMAGLFLFGLASLVGGLAWAPWVLVAARFLQGIGGAALMPAALALITTTFTEEDERSRAVGFYAAMAGAGFVAGVVLGGIITHALGWRWVFFVNVPIVLVVLLLAPIVIPESRKDEAPRALDVPAAAMVTAGMTALVYAISQAPTNGWGSPVTLGALVLGALLLGSFALAESRKPAPLVPLSIFRARTVAVPNVAMMLGSMVAISQLYVLTLYFQEALGRTPIEAALLFVPMSITSVVASAVAGRTTTWLGVKRTTALGFVLLIIGLLIIVSRMAASDALAIVIAGTVVYESGFATVKVPMWVTATSDVDEGKRGLVSGVLNTSMELGNALGLGVVAAVIAAAAIPEATIAGLRWGLLTALTFAALALLVVLVGLRGGADSR